MANNARIEFPEMIDLPENTSQPAGPASFNPGPAQQPMRNVAPRTSRLEEKEQMARQQPSNGATQQFNTKRTDLYGNQSK